MKFVTLFARRWPLSLSAAASIGHVGATRAASTLTIRDALNQKQYLNQPPLITAIDRRRFATVKKKRQWNRTAQQSEDDEEEEEKEEEEDDVEDEGMPTDCRTKEFTMLSRRLDTVVGVALKTSISALGNWILQGRVRVNETVVTKKAHEIERGDLVEVWDAPYEENTRLATVHRLRIVRCRFDQRKGYVIKTKCWPNYIMENWVSGGEAGEEAQGEEEAQQPQEEEEEEEGKRDEEMERTAEETEKGSGRHTK
ncbi:hypothetical protein niasHT_038468 [Heterodera trifolii]|uniref:RNA-binding S4 domain-containing protein n=1 Tax=Heterodera trifolii TaxID=157864 RepID=A0ABD2IQV3_9BILA